MTPDATANRDSVTCPLVIATSIHAWSKAVSATGENVVEGSNRRGVCRSESQIVTLCLRPKFLIDIKCDLEYSRVASKILPSGISDYLL